MKLALPDQLAVARIAVGPLVVVLFEWDFSRHDYWATAVFAVAIGTDWLDGVVALRRGRSSALGSLLDPIADEILVLAVLVVLVGRGVFPGWMVAAISRASSSGQVYGWRRSSAASSFTRATSAS